MDKDYLKINNYLTNDTDMIIINRLLKYHNINKKNLSKIIRKLDNYHINYQIDNLNKTFNHNQYHYYLNKCLKELKLKEDKDIICNYLQNNILKNNLKKLLKEIEIVING